MIPIPTPITRVSPDGCWEIYLCVGEKKKKVAVVSRNGRNYYFTEKPVSGLCSSHNHGVRLVLKKLREPSWTHL